MSKKHCKHIEQKNRYLDDLGLDFFEYGVNRPRRETKKRWRKTWRKQRETYGLDDRETYDMTRIYAEWLYSHLMMYRKRASKIIDLTYYKFEFEGKTYTEIEAVDKILKWTKYFIKHHNDRDRYDKVVKKLQNASRLWSEILPSVWW